MKFLTENLYPPNFFTKFRRALIIVDKFQLALLGESKIYTIMVCPEKSPPE